MFANYVAGIAMPGVILALLLTYIVFREALLDAIDLKGDLISRAFIRRHTFLAAIVR